MKISLRDLKPNPYRQLDIFPLRKSMVEILVNNMKRDGFMGSITVRPHEGKYQIAYGHHRVEAAKKCGIKEIECEVRDGTDNEMVQWMIAENVEDWGTTQTDTAVQSVKLAKDYLESELKKYKTWDEMKLVPNSGSELFYSQQSFANCKSQGVGQPIIKKFLGDNWLDWIIEKALVLLNNNEIDIEAISELAFEANTKRGKIKNTIDYAVIAADEFRKHKIKKEDQREVIKYAKKHYESEPFQDIKTSHSGNGPRKEEKFRAAIECGIEDVGYKTQKENFNKVFEKDEKGYDAEKELTEINKKLTQINSSLVGGVLDLWNDIDNNDAKTLFLSAVKNTVELLKSRFGEVSKWEQKKLT